MTNSIIIALGFIGSIISAAAYVPQIYHLVHERCTAGLSKRAFGLWLVASVLMLVNALYIGSPVFVFLTSVQTVATAIIFGFTVAYNGKVCEYHAHHGLAPAA
ncbi:MAG TPA: PQ-loop repeat-containing protein [Candidatus Saccharimonadales bacterium]|nr:PQ-loop repeat-containing protein [Candidatus Saccharimonadales bacterium]